MELYGLFVFSHHGWSSILRVMSPEGATAAAAEIEAGPDILVEAGAGQLPKYKERRKGALEALIRRHGIQILDHNQWNEKKAELGDRVLR